MSSVRSADDLVAPAIDLVAEWLRRADDLGSRDDRRAMDRLGALISDEHGVDFVMQFVDRVARPDSDRVAAHQLAAIVAGSRLPRFLSPIDRVLLRVGTRIAPLVPSLVMPIARRRMRTIVGLLVAPADHDALGAHLAHQRQEGYDVNVNLLGEAVLGEREARARLDRLIELVRVPEIDYVSVKITSVASQLNHWAYEDSRARVIERIAELVDAGAAVDPPTFINLDMEEYHDLHLTVDAFTTVLDAPNRQHLDAGIVIQAYLPDAFDILRGLADWANRRHREGGGSIKIRLVKGANLAMERVDAAMHGWEEAPYRTKLEADANYRKCLDWLLEEDRLRGVRVGVASHNLFDVAWAKLLADNRGVASRVQFEMLQGMAAGQARAVNETVRDDSSSSMLLYTPAVAKDDFDVAIGYLFRRLEENAAPENFMRALFDLEPGSERFQAEADSFRRGTAMRNAVTTEPARTQDRRAAPPARPDDAPFRNEPDTDPSLPANREWIAAVAADSPSACSAAVITDTSELDRRLAVARQGAERWRAVEPTARRSVLHRVGDELARRRGELITTMMHEASKVFSEADVEVSEAIDFARWYGDRAADLGGVVGATFEPFGVVAVVPPWNFPTAIPAGGTLASLAAGNAVVLKPAPETPRCAEVVAEACWAAGVPDEALQFVRTPDDDVGRHLVESVDAVILTGSTDTADLFRSWKPELRLFAETSGKNALIITPNADLDLAAHDLVRSAFGHAGQKCSAASLAILVGDAYDSPRFRRQLVDAVESLTVGSPLDLTTDLAPLVGGGNDRLAHAAAHLDAGERWLVEPRFDGTTMTPGVRDGVAAGSWFHRTECFGPILGLMRADDLDEAIAIASTSDFGLTGGIHSLDPDEIETWANRVEVGNCYVNRVITGAIVRRQPFGGWKRSSVGPGAKAGGPNYVMQLGTWSPAAADGADDYEAQWAEHFAVEHDETGLFCEANIFRYRPLRRVGVRVGVGAARGEVELVTRAARLAGVDVDMSVATDDPGGAWLADMAANEIERVRLVGEELSPELAGDAIAAGVHLVDGPVTPAGRIELQHYVREQSVSITLHRFGNLVGAGRHRST
jgi:RHH-type proline utilization regulon transcriptional repressor/proline dehydrogenase/delta 1-pyrroline-5-carboxylate dehydrogenase